MAKVVGLLLAYCKRCTATWHSYSVAKRGVPRYRVVKGYILQICIVELDVFWVKL